MDNRDEINNNNAEKAKRDVELLWDGGSLYNLCKLVNSIAKFHKVTFKIDAK